MSKVVHGCPVYSQAHAAFVLHTLEAISPFLLMGLAHIADIDIALTDTYADVYARSQVFSLLILIL